MGRGRLVNISIIVTSGQATQEQLAKIGNMEENHVLAKPFTAEELLRKLKEALARNKARRHEPVTPDAYADAVSAASPAARDVCPP